MIIQICLSIIVLGMVGYAIAYALTDWAYLNGWDWVAGLGVGSVIAIVISTVSLALDFIWNCL